MRSLSRNPSDLAVASSQYDILLCSETLVSDLHHVSELLVPGFGRPVLLAGQAASCPWDGGICMRWIFANQKFECGCCEMLVVMVCGLRQKPQASEQQINSLPGQLAVKMMLQQISLTKRPHTSPPPLLTSGGNDELEPNTAD